MILCEPQRYQYFIQTNSDDLHDYLKRSALGSFLGAPASKTATTSSTQGRLYTFPTSYTGLTSQ